MPRQLQHHCQALIKGLLEDKRIGELDDKILDLAENKTERREAKKEEAKKRKAQGLETNSGSGGVSGGVGGVASKKDGVVSGGSSSGKKTKATPAAAAAAAAVVAMGRGPAAVLTMGKPKNKLSWARRERARLVRVEEAIRDGFVWDGPKQPRTPKHSFTEFMDSPSFPAHPICDARLGSVQRYISLHTPQTKVNSNTYSAAAPACGGGGDDGHDHGDNGSVN